jgi:methionyl aminopeptidase
MTITDDTQKAALIEGGKRLGRILQTLRTAVSPGVTTEELDDMAERLIREGGDDPSFLGYTPEGAHRPYPATLCVSINEEVVHGIPNESKKTLKEGDIVGLDLGLTHKGIIVDAAITVPVGHVSDISQKLLNVTEQALADGIAQCRPGNHVGDISHAIAKTIEDGGFFVVKALGGHGVGELVHEEPFIPNHGRAGTGPVLHEGMVLALEPIASVGKASVILAPDGYTYITKDGSRSAHFEHTILIENDGARIMTQ